MSSVEPIDGRHQRSARSRAAVVDAVLDLLRQRGEQPSAQEIADHAGVSLRTVFRHHDDMDSLLATALAHQTERVGHLFEPLSPMSVEDFVRHRRELFEEISGVRRAALLHANRPVVRTGLVATYAKLRDQVRSVFEVDGVTLDAVDAVSSWSTWETLRRDQGLDADAAQAVVTHTITRLLEG